MLCLKSVTRALRQSASFSTKNLIYKGVPLNKIKPFKDIPGPRALPLVGNVHRFLPIIGQFDNGNVENFLLQLHKYGDIVKLDGIPFKKPIVLIFSPTLAREMYLKEGNYPRREAIDSMHYYFEVKQRHGLATLQGKEWKEFRSKVSQSVTKMSSVLLFIEQIDTVTNDFISKMRLMRNPENSEMPDDFLNELNKWALETICLITLDCRLGCLKDNLKSDDEVQRLIDGTRMMFELMFHLENSFLWKLFKTPKLKQFFQAMDSVTGIAEKYVGYAMKRLKAKSDLSNLSMLENILLESDEKTAAIMVQDMIAGGVDTISNTLGKVLYALATHPEEQNKLFLQLQAVLPNVDSPFTNETLKKVPYLYYVLKETMRLYPPVPGNTRTTCDEIILGQYMIPKGVNVFLVHSVMCKNQGYFQEPHRFLPERWSRRDGTRVAGLGDEAPYAFQPFGSGLRSCVARYLARNEILIFIGKVIRVFELHWNYGPLELEHHLMSKVKSPLKIKVTERKV